MYQTAHQNDGFNALRLYWSKLNPACLRYDSKPAKLHKTWWAIQLLNHLFGLPNRASLHYFEERSSTVTFILKFFPYRIVKLFYFFCFHRALGISPKDLEGFCLESRTWKKFSIAWRYLGILINSHINWKKQIEFIGKKIRRSIGIKLCKLRHYVDLNILVKLHYTLIYPFLTLGILIWGNTYETTLKPIFILQKKQYHHIF